MRNDDPDAARDIIRRLIENAYGGVQSESWPERQAYQNALADADAFLQKDR